MHKLSQPYWAALVAWYYREEARINGDSTSQG